MILIREYQLKDINWVLLPDLLAPITDSIPANERKRDEWALYPAERFCISTLSQHTEVDTADDFLQFIEKSTEPALLVEAELACMQSLKGSYANSREPAYFRLEWGKNNRIRIELARMTTTIALSHLERIEKVLQLVGTSPAKTKEASKDAIPLKKQVFIAHSFDDKGRSYAYQLTKFLNLLGFEVATGEGYSAEKVSTKVKRRLLAKELVIAIITPKDDSTWLIQEMAGADFLGKPLIPLIEGGVDFKSGIHGDLEYIKFKESEISQTFAPIIEGLRELGYSFDG